MTLGYTAAQLSLFRALATGNQAWFIYFAIGLFPTWALQTLRDRVRTAFARDETGCEILPLCLVEGVDDGIIDRLSEIGAWDIQHLATMKPIELAMRTLYPLPRVLDWIDQAVLIGYVRRKIPIFRSFGIRGSIDLAVLYGDATGLLAGDDEESESSMDNEEQGPGAKEQSEEAANRNSQPADKSEDSGEDAQRKERARKVLAAVAPKVDMTLETLMNIGRLLFEDTSILLIWDLWNLTDDQDQITPAPTDPAGAADVTPKKVPES